MCMRIDWYNILVKWYNVCVCVEFAFFIFFSFPARISFFFYFLVPIGESCKKNTFFMYKRKIQIPNSS